jgi:hypothetical protein
LNIKPAGATNNQYGLKDKFSLQLLFKTFFILREIQRDIVNIYSSSSYTVPVILVKFS